MSEAAEPKKQNTFEEELLELEFDADAAENTNQLLEAAVLRRNARAVRLHTAGRASWGELAEAMNMTRSGAQAAVRKAEASDVELVDDIADADQELELLRQDTAGVSSIRDRYELAVRQRDYRAYLLKTEDGASWGELADAMDMTRSGVQAVIQAHRRPLKRTLAKIRLRNSPNCP